MTPAGSTKGMGWWADVHHFTPTEFDSPDIPHSGGHYMDERFVRKLDTLRGLFKKPLVVSSGYRSPGHNKKVGGAPGSMHTRGLAADLLVAGEDAFNLVGLAYACGFTGIGVSQKGEWGRRFIHLDLRDKPTIWSY